MESKPKNLTIHDIILVSNWENYLSFVFSHAGKKSTEPFFNFLPSEFIVGTPKTLKTTAFTVDRPAQNVWGAQLFLKK